MVRKIVGFFIFIYFGLLMKDALAFEPLTTTTALALLAALGGTAAVGGGIAGLFGKKKSKQQDDPLADIRAQLRMLASEVPEMVARRKELIGKRFTEARTEGIEEIGEEIRGRRGFGAATMEDELRNELIDKLAQSQAEADLEAETGGLKLRAGILGQEAGIPYPEYEEEKSIWPSVLETGAGLFGQELGYRNLKDLFKEEDDFDIRERPGTIRD